MKCLLVACANIISLFPVWLSWIFNTCKLMDKQKHCDVLKDAAIKNSIPYYVAIHCYIVYISKVIWLHFANNLQKNIHHHLILVQKVKLIIFSLFANGMSL
jgi:hypothetical protein